MDSTPEFLYRFFDNEQYALDFFNFGRFRLKTQKYYSQIEDDARKDSFEGSAHFKCNDGAGGTEDSHWEHLNCTYIFCTSSPDVDLETAKAQFGQFVVKINTPESLLQDMKSVTYPFKVIDLFLKKVDYSRGLKREVDLATYCNDDTLSAWQKPLSYSSECEYRYVMLTNDCSDSPANPFIDINLNRKLSYLEKLW